MPGQNFEFIDTLYRYKGNPNDSDTMRFSDTFSADQKCH